MDFYYNGAWRMDWGLGNPNKTAGFIACLMIAVWSIALIWKKGFWPALVIFIALAWCLVQTYSRGGMVACLAGIAVLLYGTPRPWPKARWFAAVVSLWVLGGFVFYAKAQTRYDQGLFAEDQSINHRLVIWKHVPEMMSAAPWGWGFGKAGDAYTQWFQPFSQSQNYLNVVNSHLNFMVEAGWVGSVLYLFAWFAMFLLCWPISQSRWRALPLAIWVTFFVGGCFSHIEESICLWILPLCALICVVWERIRARDWPSSTSLAASGAVSAAIVVGLIATGNLTTSQPINYTRGLVIVGNGPVQTVIFVDRKVMGSLFGHAFRKFVASNHDALNQGAYCFVESSRDLPPAPTTRVIVSGRFARESEIVSQLKGTQIVIINPACAPDEASLAGDSIGRTTVYFGEYSQISDRSSWSNVPGIKTLQIDGAGDFVPSWPMAILGAPKT